ncbi:hypothetical protein CYLTODRAFT_487790 [Cylindrobasidium torrendii FP15055 ss-10]|uniref:Uncharacterized protein n=1 Tax=Cylindrobasidium torrendii FP15055 ss-10 TaxID=1314674 RepID=A0A0D7BKN6_9AGAR|nr:hypothetical protein CYLTODRAFT_487790 [Cylindrobasidium torrendii FP15055 ss-10]
MADPPAQIEDHGRVPFLSFLHHHPPSFAYLYGSALGRPYFLLFRPPLVDFGTVCACADFKTRLKYECAQEDMWDKGKTFKCEMQGHPTTVNVDAPPALSQQQPPPKRRRLGVQENLCESLDSAPELEEEGRGPVVRETQTSDSPDENENVPPAAPPPNPAPNSPYFGVRQQELQGIRPLDVADAPRSVPSFHSLVQSLDSTYPPRMPQPLLDVYFAPLPHSESTTPSSSPYTAPSFLEPPTLGPSPFPLEPPTVGPDYTHTYTEHAALWMDTPTTFLTFDTPAQELQKRKRREEEGEDEDDNEGDLISRSYSLVYARPRSSQPRRSSRRN